VDREYYEREIEPLLDAPGIEYVGEIGEKAKNEFLGNAAALLFPIDWPEPFGLVMIEALACGTPVVAWRCGSVPEVIADGTSGFICGNIDQAVRAVERLGEISRHRCRREFETRFRAARMAEDYTRIYERLIERRRLEPLDKHGRDYSSPRPVLHSGDVVAGG
jgi:glycosyltransferase involved in cell wall biosynthesis